VEMSLKPNEGCLRVRFKVRFDEAREILAETAVGARRFGFVEMSLKPNDCALGLESRLWTIHTCDFIVHFQTDFVSVVRG